MFTSLTVVVILGKELPGGTTITVGIHHSKQCPEVQFHLPYQIPCFSIQSCLKYYQPAKKSLNKPQNKIMWITDHRKKESF